MTPPNLPAQAGFVQFDVVLGAWQENLAAVRRSLADLTPGAGSLLVLPELWATGFAYERLAELAEVTPTILSAIEEEARRYQCLIAGSLLECDRQTGLFHNTLYVTGPGGVRGAYRKQQLFAPMLEDCYFQPGDNPLPVLTEFGPMACLVCYDLRFPDLARHQAGLGANLILVSAQWPVARKGHWRTLLQARAIENQAFVVGCNRCGVTGDTLFGGGSILIDPNGGIVVEADDQPRSALVRLHPEVLNEVRGRFCTVAASPYRGPDKRKILALPDLQAELARVKATSRQIVFSNGCFDILHQGHVTYLEAARRQGDCLVVGVNSDSSVRAIKGPDRPMNREASRARVLAALGCVDYVVLFEEETPLRLISTIRPDILVKGADWALEKIVGAAEVLAAGGRVINIPLVADFSTTGLIEAIRGK